MTNELGRAGTATVLSTAILVFMARNGSPITSWVMARKGLQRTGRRPRRRHAPGAAPSPCPVSKALRPSQWGRSARPLQSGRLASSPSWSASSGHRRPAPSGAPLPQLARSLRPTKAVPGSLRGPPGRGARGRRTDLRHYSGRRVNTSSAPAGADSRRSAGKRTLRNITVPEDMERPPRRAARLCRIVRGGPPAASQPACASRGVASQMTVPIPSSPATTFTACARGREDLVAVELGPKPEHEVRSALAREVDVERWSGLDKVIQIIGDDTGFIALRPDRPGVDDPEVRHLAVSRLQKLERMGLATAAGPGQWMIGLKAGPVLRDLGMCGATSSRPCTGPSQDAVRIAVSPTT
jgi:hypothetical protein